jgi:hypothetical protein
MATTRISITVDRELLDEGSTSSRRDFELSALVEEVLRGQISRLRLLDEMDRDGSDLTGRRGQAVPLWQQIASR